ncbi:hypothetical protein [Caldilinea sp.]|jgi:hypothetical protein|uniref:hypothetical protein n=1 Tax=Caldilinea sp. TaxID=2293560 RepID=UPI0021DED746|nr:hypothetical protein [Caldilinea sp.]GIV69348.1 MAG: hypothetical protein KatS3mg048_2210 [Caldilinea sp.]
MDSTTEGAHAYTRKFYHADGLGQLNLTLEEERIRQNRNERWKFGEKKEAHGTFTVPIIECTVRGQRIVGAVKVREESIYERRGVLVLDTPAWCDGERPLYVELMLDDAGQASAVAREAWEWLIRKMAFATARETQESEAGTDTASDSEVARQLEAVRGWPDARKRGVRRRDYVASYSIDESTLTRWRNRLRKAGYDVPDF